jgi:hypothetical protein
MTRLSASDLEYMQASIEELLPDTCYILSPTLTADGAGGFTESFGTAGTADCCLDAKSGGERTVGASIQPVFSYMLTLPFDTTILDTYRVEVDSNTFTVTSIDLGKSWDACLRVTLERV